jgi:hypothetical protein
LFRFSSSNGGFGADGVSSLTCNRHVHRTWASGWRLVGLGVFVISSFIGTRTTRLNRVPKSRVSIVRISALTDMGNASFSAKSNLAKVTAMKGTFGLLMPTAEPYSTRGSVADNGEVSRADYDSFEWYQLRNRVVTDYRDRKEWKRFGERVRTPTDRGRQLSKALARLLRNWPPDIPLEWWYHRHMSPAEQLEFDRLNFALGRETHPVSTKVQQRELERAGVVDDPEFVRNWRFKYLRRAVLFLDRRVQLCEAGGISRNDPYFVECCQQRKKLRRLLRQEIRRLPYPLPQPLSERAQEND